MVERTLGRIGWPWIGLGLGFGCNPKIIWPLFDGILCCIIILDQQQIKVSQRVQGSWSHMCSNWLTPR